jgi:hypothetical protein
MSNSNKIASLETLSSDLLDTALVEIRLHRKKSSSPKEKYYCSAEYLLQEAMEYVTAAWEMIESGNPNASIALSRWSLEASLDLLWTVANSNEIEKRHKALIGEALRNDACLREGYAKLWPHKSQHFQEQADKARKERKDLCVKQPGPLYERLESIKKQSEINWPDLYPLYRICCAAAHPSLKVWERFDIADDSIVSKNPMDKQSIACDMAARAAFYLVIFTYRLTDLGDPKQLKDWWDNKVQPLLNDD